MSTLHTSYHTSYHVTVLRFNFGTVSMSRAPNIKIIPCTCTSSTVGPGCWQFYFNISSCRYTKCKKFLWFQFTVNGDKLLNYSLCNYSLWHFIKRFYKRSRCLWSCAWQGFGLPHFAGLAPFALHYIKCKIWPAKWGVLVGLGFLVGLGSNHNYLENSPEHNYLIWWTFTNHRECFVKL